MSREPQLFRIDPSTRNSKALAEVEFAQLGLRERSDIQEWVDRNPGIMGEDLLIIAKEFSGFDRTSERLDLLAVDYSGTLVVIELKRDDTGADAYWQAIKYASYLRRANEAEIIGMLADHAKISEEDAGARLLKHLEADDFGSLNNSQRIILASHRFAPEVTSAALWLNEKVPGEALITCVQLTPYRDEMTDSLYLQANTIIPVPGEEAYAVQIGDRQLQRRASSFAVNLQSSYYRNQNDDVTHFVRKAADLALSQLPDGRRPDRRSRWAGGWSVQEKDYRIYRVWYSREPWHIYELSYRMILYRREGEPGPWPVNVEFGDFSGELARRVAELEVHKDQIMEDSRIFVRHTGEVLDDQFANSLADSLRRFVEVIAPVVDQYEDERNQEET